MKVDANTIFSGRPVPERLHSVCKLCIEHAREKYTGFMSDEGTYHQDGFAISCPFIPSDERYISSKLKSQMSPEEWDLMNSLKSPLLWGEANLVDPDNGKPWKAWSYQRGPLLCSSPRKCYRFGRRCLPTGTPILMADGSWKSIEKVRPGDKVVSRNKKAQNVGKKVLNFWENGEKEIFRVTLGSNAPPTRIRA